MIDRSFFIQPTVTVAQALLGMTLSVYHQKYTIRARICETEAYTQEDPACHAYGGRQTDRSKPMFLNGGHIFIYMIYGMYHCLNIVTEPAGRGCSVLIRGVTVTDGLEAVQYHRGESINPSDLTNGPAKLMIGLGIPCTWNELDIVDPSSPLQISGQSISSTAIESTTRIGISRGKTHPWRFYIRKTVD